MKTTAAVVSTLSVSVSTLTDISFSVWLTSSLSNSRFLGRLDAVNLLAAGVVTVGVTALLEIWANMAL